MGPHRYTTDEYIETLDLPKGPEYCVMIDGKDFLNESIDCKNVINKLFSPRKKSFISTVRIAINFNKTLEVERAAKELKTLGYKVAINLMQSHNKKENEFTNIAKKIALWKSIDILYFSDSLGSMAPKEVKKICKALKSSWSGILGIHTHNNKSLALINTITAIENEITWCDSTISGMGRGAGNTSTESLLLELSQLGRHYGNPEMLVPTVEDFGKLKNQYDWGPNLYYHYASNNNIHPTYVQALMADKRYDNQQVIEALKFLSKQDSTSYTSRISLMAVYGNQKSEEGKWDATDWLKDQEVLMVAAGPSVNHYKEGILSYIKKKQPAVLFLNYNRYLPGSSAKATIICHETRTMFDAQLFKKLEHPLILPLARLGKLIQEQLKGITIYDYGLSLEENAFQIGPRSCKLQWGMAAAYALAVSTQANAKIIKLVGFDGFDLEDPRHHEMNDVFKAYNKLSNSIDIVSLTPTNYEIRKGSIFSPDIE